MTSLAIPARWWLTVAVLIVTAALLSPFYWVLVGSFMTPAELFGAHPSLWPKHFAVENWPTAPGHPIQRRIEAIPGSSLRNRPKSL